MTTEYHDEAEDSSSFWNKEPRPASFPAVSRVRRWFYPGLGAAFVLIFILAVGITSEFVLVDILSSRPGDGQAGRPLLFLSFWTDRLSHIVWFWSDCWFLKLSSFDLRDINWTRVQNRWRQRPSSSPVLLTCPLHHLSSTPVLLTCPLHHLSSTPVLLLTCPHLSSSPVLYTTCPPHLSSTPVLYTTCPPHLSSPVGPGGLQVSKANEKLAAENSCNPGDKLPLIP